MSLDNMTLKRRWYGYVQQSMELGVLWWVAPVLYFFLVKGKMIHPFY